MVKLRRVLAECPSLLELMEGELWSCNSIPRTANHSLLLPNWNCRLSDNCQTTDGRLLLVLLTPTNERIHTCKWLQPQTTNKRYLWLGWHTHTQKMETMITKDCACCSLFSFTHPLPEAMMTNVRVKALISQSHLLMLVPTAPGPLKQQWNTEKEFSSWQFFISTKRTELTLAKHAVHHKGRHHLLRGGRKANISWEHHNKSGHIHCKSNPAQILKMEKSTCTMIIGWPKPGS